MGEIVAIQYIQAERLSPEERAERKLPATGWIKKTIEFGSFITDMHFVEDPARDILISLSSMKADFTHLKTGDLSDIFKE